MKFAKGLININSFRIQKSEKFLINDLVLFIITRSRRTPPQICRQNPQFCTPNQNHASTKAPPPARTLQHLWGTARPIHCPITSRMSRNYPIRSRTTRKRPIRCRWFRYLQSSITTFRWAIGVSTTPKD